MNWTKIQRSTHLGQSAVNLKIKINMFYKGTRPNFQWLTGEIPVDPDDLFDCLLTFPFRSKRAFKVKQEVQQEFNAVTLTENTKLFKLY